MSDKRVTIMSGKSHGRSCLFQSTQAARSHTVRKTRLGCSDPVSLRTSPSGRATAGRVMRSGTSLVELVVVTGLLSVTLATSTGLLVMWQTHSHQRNVRWRRVVERERLAGVLEEDLGSATDVRIVGKRLLITVRSSLKAERIEYRLGESRVERWTQSPSGELRRGDTFLWSGGATMTWDLAGRGDDFVVRLGSSGVSLEQPVGKTVDELGIVVSGRMRS